MPPIPQTTRKDTVQRNTHICAHLHMLTLESRRTQAHTCRLTHMQVKYVIMTNIPFDAAEAVHWNASPRPQVGRSFTLCTALHFLLCTVFCVLCVMCVVCATQHSAPYRMGGSAVHTQCSTHAHTYAPRCLIASAPPFAWTPC
jgi:hypothetical protein